MMSKGDGTVASASHKTGSGPLRTAVPSVIEQSYVNHREAMRMRGAFAWGYARTTKRRRAYRSPALRPCWPGRH